MDSLASTNYKKTNSVTILNIAFGNSVISLPEIWDDSVISSDNFEMTRESWITNLSYCCQEAILNMFIEQMHDT